MIDGGVIARQRRRLRRMLRQRQATLVPGERPLPIDELISPLRYDVVVREQYLHYVADHLDLYGADPEAFLAGSRRQPYHAWFRSVAIHRIRPGTTGQDALDRAFRERVHKTVRLYLAITGFGFDDRYPVVIGDAGPVVTTDTGKVLSGRLYPTDGCHRLALLRFTGYRHLPPSFYRLQSTPGWRPPDNTHTLIDALGLTGPEYFSFLSAGYAGEACRDRASLLEYVAARHPDRLGELHRVILIDTPSSGFPQDPVNG